MELASNVGGEEEEPTAAVICYWPITTRVVRFGGSVTETISRKLNFNGINFTRRGFYNDYSLQTLGLISHLASVIISILRFVI